VEADAGDWEKTYTKKNLHTFVVSAPKAGQNPGGGVLLDSSGNIYSTTAYGGSTECLPGCGTVFELVASGDTYEYKVLWKFNGTDGAYPTHPGDLKVRKGVLPDLFFSRDARG
jgi:hypothetical protein